MKRYKLVLRGSDGMLELREFADGDLVRYSDVQALERVVEAAEAVVNLAMKLDDIYAPLAGKIDALDAALREVRK